LRLTTHDGEQLGAWFVPGRERLPVVLLLHGNGGCRRKCARQAELLQSLGHPVLLISFRAHEDSTGEVNDFGYSGRHDVVAAVDWLEQNQPGRPILVWGQSAGAAAALFAAEELGSHVHGYILECPYRDLHTAVRNRTRMYLPPLVDALGAQGLFLIAPLVLPHADSISPLKAAARVPTSTPVLLLAGGKDRHALPEEAQDIQQCLGARARLVVFEGADHVKLLQADPERYRDCVTCFLEEITAGVPGR
jgi:alpha-beta hydrolase superfamily lysophospholipase